MTEELETTKPGQAEADAAAEAATETTPPQASTATESPAPPVLPPTPEALEALRQKAAKADENYDLYLRTRAELDNFRKRSARDRAEAVKFASQGLLEKLIPVLDNFDMAMSAVNSSAQASTDTLKQGVAMVQNQLKSILSDAGVQEIEASGQAFDPNQHEAVSEMESTTVPEGHVLQQLRKGYRLHERLIRPATVIVAKPPAA